MSPQNRLSIESVRAIRGMSKDGYTNFDIAKLFEICSSGVSRIVRKKTYNYDRPQSFSKLSLFEFKNNVFWISEFGEVFSCFYRRWLAPYTDKDGYIVYSMCGKSLKSHHLVLSMFTKQKRKDVCRHLDGEKKNNHYTNLKWGTYSENERDKILHGVSNNGIHSGAKKLNIEKVKEILKSKNSNVSLAKKYCVSETTIRKIKKGKIWKRLQQ